MRFPYKSELVVDASMFIALLSLPEGRTLLENLSEIYELITTREVIKECEKRASRGN